MKQKLLFVFSLFLVSQGWGQIAAWDFTGIGGTTIASTPATTFNSNLISSAGTNNITRGATAGWSFANNSWRTIGFQKNGISTSNTNYFQITLSAATGYKLSLSTIDAKFAGTPSFAVSPGVSNQFAYSLDGTTFTLIGSPRVLIGSPATLTQIDLSGIAALQSVANGTIVTLRYYASGQTTTGGWGFNSPASGQNGLAINGVVASNTWVGSTSASWSTASNWSSNAVPGSSDDVYIPSGTPNSPTYSTLTTIASLNISSGATLTNSGVINVTNNFTNSGTINLGTINIAGSLVNNGSITVNSTIGLNGSSAQTISGTGTIANLTIANTSGGVSITNGTTTVNNLVTLQSGTLTTGGRLILASDANATASIAAVDGTTNTGTISGSVVVQRFIPSSNRKKYTLVSAPVGSPTINTTWQEASGTVAGFGTHITNAQTTNGFDGPVGSTASIFTYNDALGNGFKWNALANTNVNTLSQGTGYLLFVRGDRSENRPVTGNSSNTTLRAIGSILIGNVTFATTGGTAGTPALLGGNGKYTLIANPYASAINWASNVNGPRDITLTNVADQFYVYDSNTGVFETYDNGTGITSPSGSAQGKYIQSGQAFFVQSTGATPSIVFSENAKSITTTSMGSTVFGVDATRPKLNINIFRTTDNVFADGVVAVFDKNYKVGIANEDASKFTNFNETFALLRNGSALSIEGHPLITANDTLHFSLINFGKRDYTFNIDGSNFTNTIATLEDKFTATKIPLDLMVNNTYTFSVNDDAASVANDRFTITFGSTVKLTTDVASDNNFFVKMSPNPVSSQLQVNFKTAEPNQTTINIINSLGQIVRSVNAGKVDAGTISIPVTTLVSGLYTVQLLSGDKQISSQKVVKE